MQLIEVTDKSLAQDFILVNVHINKGNPRYIRPLDKDVHDVFDPKKNKTFRSGTAIRWILKNDEGESIGRIAAFVNKKYKIPATIVSNCITTSTDLKIFISFT